MNRNIELGDDIIDSRDVIEKISELENDIAYNFEHRNDESRTSVAFAYMRGVIRSDIQDLKAWRDFADQGEGYADWEYGESFISDDYFETYAREFASDIGAINEDAGWPNTFIDWHAASEALLQDYSEIEVKDADGVKYVYWSR